MRRAVWPLPPVPSRHARKRHNGLPRNPRGHGTRPVTGVPPDSPSGEFPTQRQRPKLWYTRLSESTSLAVLALIVGWLAFAFLATGNRDPGLAMAAFASLIVWIALRKG